MSADTALGVFFGRNTDRFGKRFKEVAVIGEPAFFKCFHHTCAVTQESFGNADPSCSNIFTYGGAGGSFEDAADIGFAYVEFTGKLAYGQRCGNILTNP